jgi:cysteine desulfuration protein SufE
VVPALFPSDARALSRHRLAPHGKSTYIWIMETTRPAPANEAHSQVSFDDIVADFDLLEDWEDRYRYVIELGRKLQPLPDAERNDTNKVRGCVSQVWLATTIRPDNRAPLLSFVGDSDAHIVRGLIAILFALYSGKSADAILAIDANEILGRLHLKEHLTPQRSNGLLAMVERIRNDARHAIENAPTVH